MTEDPAIQALFGPAPSNVDLSDSAVSTNNAAVIAMLCLAAVAVMLRFTARIILRNALMVDDWAIIAALVLIGATTGLSVAGGTTGAGSHIWAVTLEQLEHLYRLLFIYTFLYAASCTCTRISIIFFYRRVFSPLETPLKAALFFAGFLTSSYPIIIWVTMGNSCKPVSHFWTQFSGTTGECIDVDHFFLALGIINMLNDFIILVIPFPRIVKLQMNSRKKAAICAILAVGIFVCVASIVRIYYLSVFMSSVDLTWLMGPVFIWSTIEPCVAVVCACLPHLAPLARLAHRAILSSYQSQNSTHKSEERLRRLPSGSGQSKQRNKFRKDGPTFDFGLDQMKRSANDDEIGLTNYVSAAPNEGKYPHPFVESVDEDLGRDGSIAVQSSFMQSTSTRPSL
ncbi:Transferase [Penicillium atrosanguineum]|uniref:Transferase n=1 Tax=Penicillium atrosanguineum TaxID=1132637 RepID=UPI0023831BDB|nr:Transferase [Penicillium atrosanguineum]KAJ5310076.1 Transferase [Penicillium atrosanguineum]